MFQSSYIYSPEDVGQAISRNTWNIMERFLQQTQIQGHVLLVDLALSHKHDVYQESLLRKFKCETWSEVRNLTDLPSAPRVLRTAEDPLCKQQLRISELEHLEISNYLLYVAIRLVFWAAMHNVPEHPRLPKDVSRASIWRLPWWNRMFTQRLLVKHTVFQTQFGSESAKPTNFAIGGMSGFKNHMRQFHRKVDWTQLKVLQGWN